MDFQFFPFTDLNIDILYKLLKLRQEVFIIEQNCIYLDIDDLDQQAIHVIGLDENANLLAYCRIFLFKENGIAKIGRVLVREKQRSKGLGKDLMRESINFIKTKPFIEKIEIEAQSYLKDFYNSLNFIATTQEKYLLDAIPHIKMKLQIN
ncbi:MAG: GNAT family N-acetyltransferase [Candidatus Caenarcaniphilales bacterium]|nr:GNAT family N-acetyltransferase [Candidatus Caenarcaniphilales bacterium]